MEYRRQQRANPELERAARRNELEVDLDTVKSEHLASGGMYKDIVLAADLYGIYEDLFGPDLFFTPSKELNLHFDFDEDYITPVFRGKVFMPHQHFAVMMNLNILIQAQVSKYIHFCCRTP